MANGMYGVEKVTELNSNLYLTSIYGANRENIRNRGITLLINAAQELPKVEMSSVESIKLFLDDTPYALVNVYFDRIADKMNEHIKNGGRVLVHCVLGVSRSTSLVLAYLMKHKNMSLKQAYDFVVSKRPCARPNPGFWRQLIDYEKRLSKQNFINTNNNSNSGVYSQNETQIPITIITSQKTGQNNSITKETTFSNNNNNSSNNFTFTKPSIYTNNKEIYSNWGVSPSPRSSNTQSLNTLDRAVLTSTLIPVSHYDSGSSSSKLYNTNKSYSSANTPRSASTKREPAAVSAYTLSPSYKQDFIGQKPSAFTTTYRSSYGTTTRY